MVSRVFFLIIWMCFLGTLPGLAQENAVSRKNTDARATGIRAQLVVVDSADVQVLTTTDGSTTVGRVIRVNEQDVDFRTDLGVLSIPIAKISEIRQLPATSIRNGQIWFPNPNATRLFFAPTGRMLKQGEGYFSDYYIFFPGFAYGLTDRVTVGGGMSLFPGIGMGDQIFYFTPKVGITATESFNLAAGALLVPVPWEDGPDDPEMVGILYGVSTFGSPDASFTLGLGVGFVDGNLADRPMVMVGGEKRLTRRTAFVTENWIFPGADQPLISFGLRFFGEKLSVDLGLLNTIGEETFFPGAPYIDFVVKF